MAGRNYNFMLIGRSEIGKTTLGDKLQRQKPETAPFELNADARVLEVPGFPGSGGPESGLQILCEFVKEHKQEKVQRVIYFLPTRGPLERADGSLQEELQVMHRFFGADVFNCMIVIATNNPHSQQQSGFDEEEQEQTEKVFHLALNRIIEGVGCPPIVFIGESEVEVAEKLNLAKVLRDEALDLSQVFVTDADCSLCNATVRYNQRENLGVSVESTLTAYDKSKCHPTPFVPKYAGWKKVVGTFIHIFIAFGIILIIQKYIMGKDNVWPPLLNNSEKICSSCERAPRSPGCEKVKEHDIVHKK